MGTALREHHSNGELAEPTGMDLVARGDTMQQMRTSYSTAVAVQRPRELAAVERRFLQEAAMAGETFYYGWGAGKDKIEGASIKLASALARCWGNCAVEPMPIQETADAWIMTAAFIDLETGFTIARQFRQSKKYTVHGKHDAERKDDIRFQIGQSKAARNVILNALPEWMADKAIAAAKAGVKKTIEEYVSKNGVAKAVDHILRALAKVGVSEERVLAKLSLAKKTAIDIDHIVLLKGDLSAIESGQEWADNLFPNEDGSAPSKVKKSTLGEAEPEVAGETKQQDQPAAGELRFDLAKFHEVCQTAKTVREILEADEALRGPEGRELGDDETVLADAWRAEAQDRIKANRGERSNQKTMPLGEGNPA